MQNAGEGKGELTHFDGDGNALMVDVSAKAESYRLAVAAGSVTMSEAAYNLVKQGAMAKGDVVGVARLAGIMAAKKVPDLIPLTHPLMISKVSLDFIFHDATCALEIQATVGICGKTGVEMEALTAVSVAALTVYDMCKAVDKTMIISNIRLLSKSGGKSGLFLRQESVNKE